MNTILNIQKTQNEGKKDLKFFYERKVKSHLKVKIRKSHY